MILKLINLKQWIFLPLFIILVFDRYYWSLCLLCWLVIHNITYWFLWCKLLCLSECLFSIGYCRAELWIWFSFCIEGACCLSESFCLNIVQVRLLRFFAGENLTVLVSKLLMSCLIKTLILIFIHIQSLPRAIWLWSFISREWHLSFFLI